MLDDQKSPLELTVPPDENEREHCQARNKKTSDSTCMTQHVFYLSYLKVTVRFIGIVPRVRAVHPPWHRPRKKSQITAGGVVQLKIDEAENKNSRSSNRCMFLPQDDGD